MKKYCLLLITFLFTILYTSAAVTPTTMVNETPAMGINSSIKYNPLTIATLKVKQVEKIVGRKLKLKEKIALKFVQWKIKKGIHKRDKEKSGKGNTAMILGIIAIGVLLLPYIALASIPCAILAIIFGNQAKKIDPDDGQAKAGVILGWVALGLIVAAYLFLVLLFASGGFGWG